MSTTHAAPPAAPVHATPPPAPPEPTEAQKAAAAKKAQKEADKKAKAEAKVAAQAQKIVGNGISRPKADTKTGKVWEICDALSAQLGRPPERKLVMDAATKEGINEATCATQFGRWRKFHGLKGPSVPPAPAADIVKA